MLGGLALREAQLRAGAQQLLLRLEIGRAALRLEQDEVCRLGPARYRVAPGLRLLARLAFLVEPRRERGGGAAPSVEHHRVVLEAGAAHLDPGARDGEEAPLVVPEVGET